MHGADIVLSTSQWCCADNQSKGVTWPTSHHRICIKWQAVRSEIYITKLQIELHTVDEMDGPLLMVGWKSIQWTLASRWFQDTASLENMTVPHFLLDQRFGLMVKDNREVERQKYCMYWHNDMLSLVVVYYSMLYGHVVVMWPREFAIAFHSHKFLLWPVPSLLNSPGKFL